MELPAALHAVVEAIHRELSTQLQGATVGAADAAVLRAIVDRLARFPSPAGAGDE